MEGAEDSDEASTSALLHGAKARKKPDKKSERAHYGNTKKRHQHKTTHAKSKHHRHHHKAKSTSHKKSLFTSFVELFTGET